MNNEPELKVRKKRYDQNFKRSAVEHWLGSGKSADQVADELGIPAVAAIHHMVNRAGIFNPQLRGHRSHFNPPARFCK
jgi:hypothetical protein